MYGLSSDQIHKSGAKASDMVYGGGHGFLIGGLDYTFYPKFQMTYRLLFPNSLRPPFVIGDKLQVCLVVGSV